MKDRISISVDRLAERLCLRYCQLFESRPVDWRARYERERLSWSFLANTAVAEYHAALAETSPGLEKVQNESREAGT